MNRARPTAAVLILVILTILAGCSTTSRTRGGGGYYKDDGPGSLPADVQNIPDAVPRIETYNPANSRPYVVFGKRYVPTNDEAAFQQTGVTSWYGKKFHGYKTANGETYNMYAMTAAHPTLPIPSYARITRTSTGKSVIVRINDRGPFLSNRIIDLSYVAAAKLGILGQGSAQVTVQAITNDDIRNNAVQIAAVKPTSPAAPIASSVRLASATTPEALAPIQNTPSDRPVGDDNSAGTDDSLRDTGVARDAALLTSSSFRARTQSAGSTGPARATRVIDSGVYLQFGAFSGEENAARLAQTLNQHIGQIEARQASVQTADNLHKVQIGPYPSRTAAVNAAALIKQATGMDPTIATR
ncbi:MAG: septal ring lytic transglycosylase RlpA family protein [Burkholderiaceae bacterium]